MSYMQPGNPAKRLRLFMAVVLVVSLAFTWKLVEFQVVRAAEIKSTIQLSSEGLGQVVA